MRRRLRVASCLVSLWVGLATPAGSTTEHELKAAFLLNFVRLIEWPTVAFGDEDAAYTLGVFAEDPFDGALEAVLDEARVEGRPLHTKRIVALREARSCHVVFVPASQARHLPALQRQLAGAPVLLVTEGEGLAGRGAAISFYREGERIRFEVNREALEGGNLKPSSRLLRLARLVGPERP